MFNFQGCSNKIITKFKDSEFLKGISTLIGASLMNFLVGGIYSLCTLSVYEISYIKGIGGSISIDHLTFYYPVEVFFQCISAFVSGIIYKEIGLHFTNFIGVSVLSFGYAIMYLSKNLFFDILAMIFGGIGTGIIYYPSTTNSYEWFKENNGLIVGIMETMISFGSFFWAFIGEKIINSEAIESDDETNLYSMEIAIKIKIYLIIQIVGWLFAYIISFILMYERKNYNTEIQIDIKSEEGDLFSKQTNSVANTDLNQHFLNDNENIIYDENIIDSGYVIGNKKDKMIYDNKMREEKLDEDNNDTIEKKLSKTEILKEKNERRNTNRKRRRSSGENKGLFHLDLNLKFDADEFLITEEDNEDDDEEKEISLKNLLKFTVKSKRLILFIVIMIMQSPVSNMAFTLYREIGEYYKVELKYLQLVGSFYFIFECLSSFVFGVLCDYIQLKYLFLFINIIGTVVGFTYCLTFQNGLIFFLVQNFLSFSAGGYYPVKDCYLLKVFGKSIYIELSALVSFLVSVAINLLTPISFFIMSGLEDKKMSYWILFVSFGIINLVGTILNFFLSETPIDKNELKIFAFEDDGNEEKEKNKNEEEREEKEEDKV